MDLNFSFQTFIQLFTYDLFKTAVTSSDYIASNDRMINKLEGLWKDAIEPNLRYYSGICVEGLRNTT
jgi:hypothetical protein